MSSFVRVIHNSLQVSIIEFCLVNWIPTCINHLEVDIDIRRGVRVGGGIRHRNLSPGNGEVKYFIYFLITFFDLYRQSGRLIKRIIAVIRLQHSGLNFIRVNRHGIGLGINVVSTSRFCVCGLVTSKTAFLRKVPISFRVFTKCSRTYTRRKSIMHHTRRNTASNGFRNFLKHTVQCTSIVRVISMVTIRCNAIF